MTKTKTLLNKKGESMKKEKYMFELSKKVKVSIIKGCYIIGKRNSIFRINLKDFKDVSHNFITTTNEKLSFKARIRIAYGVFKWLN